MALAVPLLLDGFCECERCECDDDEDRWDDEDFVDDDRCNEVLDGGGFAAADDGADMIARQQDLVEL